MEIANQHTSYYELREALEGESCALCHLAQKGVQRFLDHLLYENVNNPEVRRDVRQARGFCNLHAWQLRDRRGSLGIAILHRDVLETVIGQIRRVHLPHTQQTHLSRVWATLHVSAVVELADDSAPQQLCIACRTRKSIETLYAQTLLEHIGDSDIARAFSHSGGLCLPHFRQTLQQVKDGIAARKLIAMQLAVWDQLLGELNEFIRKQDYRFRDEGLAAEGDAWLRAIAAISGQRETR